VLLVPTAFVALFPVFFWIGGQETVPFLPNAAFAVAWPLAFGLMLWAVRWTLRAAPQPPWTETYALPSAYLLQLLWVNVLFDAMDQPLFSTPEFVAVAVGGVAMFFMPDILARTDALVDNRVLQLLLGTGLTGGALVVFGAVAYLFESQLGSFAAVGGAVVIVIGLVGAVVLWLDDRTSRSRR
jgi:FtsH-binding integral membrane protein